MTDSEERIRWRTGQRFEFIEFMLFWEGGIKRADIADRFGVSTPQATNDLNAYRDKAPDNLHYDSSRKRFLPTPDFQPKFLKINADRYLAQLKAITEGILKIEDTFFPESPPVDAMPIPRRFVDPLVLRRLVAATRDRRSIEILYQSMSRTRSEPIWRRITPHAFGHDGLRWHVRAYCHVDNDHADFILSRCREVRGEDKPGAAPDADAQWNTYFDVVLEPNPELTESQRNTIALDYNMVDGRATVSVRRAMLYYFDKRLRLDVARSSDRPAETPVVVSNRAEFDRALNRLSK